MGQQKKRCSWFLLSLVFAMLFLACETPEQLQNEAQQFIDGYTKEYQRLYYASSEAEWSSNTRIVEGDSSNALLTQNANQALANFVGSVHHTETIQKMLSNRDHLLPLQTKQLDIMLYNAANSPQTVADLVKERIRAETAQVEKLYSFDFQINGKSVNTNDIDAILSNERNLKKRLSAWEVSKEVGKNLRAGLVNLVHLRNRTVKALGYPDFFSYQVSNYGLNAAEMIELNRQLVAEIWPLYRELHTYARYELAKKYRANKIPDFLPAHWLPNRWGQDWTSMVTVKGIDLDVILQTKSSEWIMQQAELFYRSLGFPILPASFWEKSSLFPLPDDAGYKKNNHASAWHLDLDQDIRSLMSVIPNADWYETVHHELGHIYYYLSYSNPDIPLLLRGGANRAFHEAIGSLMGLAAMQKPFLAQINLLPADRKTDEMKILLKESLNYITFMPWSCGVMTEFEYQLYANGLPAEQYNRKWWELVQKYQGIIPPDARGEEYCDPCTKTHINDDPGQYYDYGLSYVLLFQLHEYIAKNILQQSPYATNYYGSQKVGEFLKKIMSPGRTREWRQLLLDTIGEEMSARAMLNYFAPLLKYLKKVNAGRKYTLPETI